MAFRDDNRVAMENDGSRVDVRERVTGRVRFTADQRPPGLLWARFIRFPYGAGRVVSADVDAARAVPGVVEVELERREGQFVGDRLGHVLAESRDALEDALEALALRAEPAGLEARVDAEALEVPAPSAGDRAALDALWDEAAAVAEGRFTTQVQTHSCLETHGAVVDHQGDRAEAWGSTQSTSAFHEGLLGPAGLDADALVFHCEFVGGGFGSKFGPGPEGELAARLSRKHRRPVRCMLDRKEEHLDSGNRPGSVQVYKLAARKDGKLLGGRAHAWGVVGFEPGGGGVQLGALYDFGKLVTSSDEIVLPAGRPRAFRAPGWPQAVFAIEAMMDELAALLRLDPLRLREINETSRRRVAQYAHAAKLAGWERRRPDGTWPGRVKRGWGCGGTMWKTWPTRAKAEAVAHRDGRVEIRCGVQDIGTGTNTVLVDVAASVLTLPRDRITPRLGDSRLPPGPGSGGSVTARTVAPAVVEACQGLVAELKGVAARELGVGKGDVTLTGGAFEGGGKSLAWSAVCARMPDTRITAPGSYAGLPTDGGTSDGVQIAEVDVDTETGVVVVRRVVAVQACGRVVNRKTAENQVEGGVIQGVSYALFEERLLDGPTGAMLNPNLEQYRIAGAADVPEIVVVLDANPDDVQVRPLGEPPTIPTAGAIGNAVANALGVRVWDLPITPQRVLEALARGRAGAPGRTP